MITNCPNCGQKVRTGKPGKYRCPACSKIFEPDSQSFQEKDSQAEDMEGSFDQNGSPSTDISQSLDQSGLYIDSEEAARACETCGRPGSENICKYCGKFVCTACVNRDTGHDACPLCLSKLQRQTSSYYEKGRVDLASSGFMESFFPKLKSILFSPGRFFQTPKANDKVFHQYLFALICYCFGGIFEVAYSFFIYKFLLQSQDAMVVRMLKSMEVENLLSNPSASFVKATAMLPLQGFMMIFVIAGIVHVALMIFSDPKKKFPGTLRIVAYSNATHLVRIIPVLGGILALVWQVALVIIGVTHTHRIKGERAALAVLLPMFALFGMMLILIIIAVFLLS